MEIHPFLTNLLHTIIMTQLEGTNQQHTYPISIHHTGRHHLAI